MKKFLSSLMVISALMAVGCGNQNQPQTKLSRGGRLPGGPLSAQSGTPGGTTAATMPQAPGTGGYSWGTIDASTVGDQAVKAFLSTDFTATEIGNITTPGCVTGQGYPCRIEFTITQQATPSSLPITFNGGNLISALQSPSGLIPTGGYLTMLVWDSISGTQDPQNPGQVFTPIPVVIPLSTQSNVSFARQGSVVMTFADTHGVITFNGTISGNGWVGVGNNASLAFQNYTNINGGANASGSLGAFGVVACGVFACQ